MFGPGRVCREAGRGGVSPSLRRFKQAPVGWGGREGVPVVTLAGASPGMGRVPKTRRGGYQGLTAGEMG